MNYVLSELLLDGRSFLQRDPAAEGLKYGRKTEYFILI